MWHPQTFGHIVQFQCYHRSIVPDSFIPSSIQSKHYTGQGWCGSMYAEHEVEIHPGEDASLYSHIHTEGQLTIADPHSSGRKGTWSHRGNVKRNSKWTDENTNIWITTPHHRTNTLWLTHHTLNFINFTAFMVMLLLKFQEIYYNQFHPELK